MPCSELDCNTPSSAPTHRDLGAAASLSGASTRWTRPFCVGFACDVRPPGKFASRAATGSTTRSKVFTFVPTQYCSQGVERTTVQEDEEVADTKRESEQSPSRASLPGSSYSLRGIPRHRKVCDARKERRGTAEEEGSERRRMFKVGYSPFVHSGGKRSFPSKSMKSNASAEMIEPNLFGQLVRRNTLSARLRRTPSTALSTVIGVFQDCMCS